jgi:sodium/hydrogen exchanger-like protein 6/7
MGESSTTPIIALVVLVLLVIFMAGGAFMEHKHAKVGHESGLVIILGFVVSFIVYALDKENEYSLTFDGNVFFYLLLPPIVFSSAFNMRRKRFFENIGYIFMFGILGTIV